MDTTPGTPGERPVNLHTRFTPKMILRWAVGGLALAVLLAAAVVILARAGGFGLQDAQAFIGAPLPEGASGVQFATRDQFARVVWLRFDLPASADLTAFAAALGLEPPRDGFSPFPAPNYTEAEIPWWTPHTAQQVSGLHTVHAGKVYELLADRADPARQVVYLRVYSL